MPTVYKRSVIWLDAGGRTRQTIPATLTGAGLLVGDMAAFSTAAVVEYFEGVDTFTPSTPVGGTFPDVQDIARLTFKTGAGDLVQLALPAPNVGIFLPDGVTVDPSVITLIISDAIGNLCTPAGVAVTAFVGGTRGLRVSGN